MYAVKCMNTSRFQASPPALGLPEAVISHSNRPGQTVAPSAFLGLMTWKREMLRVLKMPFSFQILFVLFPSL